MHFEPDTECGIDAGGVTEISRWCKPPELNGKYAKLLLAENRWFAPPANFQCPSGTVLPIALKVHDTL